MPADTMISEQEIRLLLDEAREHRRMGRLSDASLALEKAQAIIDRSRVEYAGDFAAERAPHPRNSDAS